MVKVNNKECGKNGVIALDITIDKSEKRDLPARRDSAHHITAKETNNNSDNHHIDNNNNESIDFSEENINTQYSKDTHTEDSSNGEHDEDSSPSLSPEPFSLPLPSFPSPLTTSPFFTPPLSNMPASSSSFLLDSSSSSSTLSASGSPPSDGVEEKQEEEKETDIQPTAGHTLPSFSCSSSSSFCSASLERGGCTNEQMAGGLPLPTPYFSSVSDDKESEKELELKMLKKRLDEVWNLKETHKRAHETAMRLMREMQQKIQELNKTVALAGGNNGGMSYRQPPTSSLSSFSSSCSSSSSSCSSSSSASPRRRVSRITSATDRGHWKANMNQHTKSIIEKCKNTAKVKAGGNSAATNTINNNTYSNGVYTKQQEDSNKNTKSNNNSIHTIDNNNRTHNVNGKNANQSNHNNHSTNPPLPPSKLKNTSVGVEEVPSNEGVVSPLSTRSSSRYTNNTSLNTSSCFSSLSSTVNLSTLFTPRVVTTTHRVPSSCGTTPRNAFIYDNNINTHFPTSPRNLNLNNYNYINTNNNNNNNNNSTKCMLNHQKCFCCNINSSSSMALCNSVFSPRVGTSNNTNSTNAYKHYNTVPPSSINNAIVQQQQSLEKVFTDMLNQTNSILKHAQMPSYTLEEVESFDLYELCSLRIPNTHLYLDVEYPTENSEGGGLPRLIATGKSSGLFRLHIRKLPHRDDKEMKINTTNNCEKTANLNKKENDSDTSTECNKNQEIHQEESFSLFSFDWLARLFGISTDPYAIEGLPPEAEKMKDTRWDEVAIEYRGTSDKEKLSRNQVTGRFIFNGGSSFGSLMSFPMCAPYAVYCLGSTPKKESIFYVQRDEREQKRKLVLYHKLSQKYMYVDEKTGNVNLGGNRRNEMTNKNADLQENNDTLVANKIDKNDAQCIQKSLSNNTVTSMNIYDKQAKIMSNNCGVNKLKSVNEENDEQTEEMNSSFDCKNSSCSSIEEKETKEVVAQKEKKEEKEQNNDSNCNNNSSSAVSVHGQSNSDNSSFSAFSESAALNQKKTYAALEAEIISLPDMLAHQVANLMLGSLAEQNDMQRYLTAQEECSGNIQEIAEAEEEQGEEKDENVFQKEVMKNTLTNGKHNNTKNHIQHKTYKAAENGNKKYTKKSSSSEYYHSSAYSSDCTNSSLYSSNEDLCGGDNLDCCENGECNACKNGTEKTGGEKKEKLRNSKKVSDRHKADVLKENSNHGKNSRTKQPISCVVPLLPLTNLRKNSSEDKADTPHDSEWRPKSTLPSCSQKRGGGGEEGGGRGVERKRRGKREEKQEEENKCFRREEEEEYEDCYDEQEEEEEAKVYNIGDDEGECETEGESYEEMYNHLSSDNEIIKDKNDVSSFSTVLEENEGPVSSFSTLEEIEETNEKPQLQNVVAHAAVPNQ